MIYSDPYIKSKINSNKNKYDFYLFLFSEK
uniref:Uncharacterized protein n=1 Tax=viral metagenome TaxID=1070528 RepID=A0A6C0H8Q1_9ZZZZ